eukprot:CAMPEP_0170513256 /NCGR_PEP_ID=MMETSP0208-20121228/67302_1 /TAXON_ID=197538 /ORGANISM="Strombidium inclinatum, Strain S3" /LENGTH=147 /DNA_ID=CAMNT_0010796975 /DNA_START=797 /DNA_END=1240 /DNA_ORIENTATION=-
MGAHQSGQVEVRVLGTALLSVRRVLVRAVELLLDGRCSVEESHRAFVNFVFDPVVYQADYVDSLSSTAELCCIRLVLPASEEFIDNHRDEACVKDSESKELAEVSSNVDFITSPLMDSDHPTILYDFVEEAALLDGEVDVPLVRQEY